MSANDMPRNEGALYLSLDELVEIDEALSTKMNYIRVGGFGPEPKAGEDKRWTSDLRAIQRKVQAAIKKIQEVRS